MFLHSYNSYTLSNFSSFAYDKILQVDLPLSFLWTMITGSWILIHIYLLYLWLSASIFVASACLLLYLLLYFPKMISIHNVNCQLSILLQVNSTYVTINQKVCFVVLCGEKIRSKNDTTGLQSSFKETVNYKFLNFTTL